MDDPTALRPLRNRSRIACMCLDERLRSDCDAIFKAAIFVHSVERAASLPRAEMNCACVTQRRKEKSDSERSAAASQSARSRIAARFTTLT